jgi:hypothetical protein
MDNLVSLDDLVGMGLGMDEAQEKGIHVTSSTCWCDPDTQYVEGKK